MAFVVSYGAGKWLPDKHAKLGIGYYDYPNIPLVLLLRHTLPRR